MKKTLLIILVLIILISPGQARDNIVEYEESKYSPWAFEYILDGQVTGLLELSKETMGIDYTQEAKKTQILEIERSLLIKLKSKGLYDGEKAGDISLGEEINRDYVLRRIYNILRKYHKTDGKKEKTYINFLREKEILRGKEDGKLYLDEAISYEEVIALYTRSLEYIYREENLGGRGIFYRLENQATSLYILGSIHSGDYFLYPLEEERIQAFEKADELYVELDLTDPDILEELVNNQMRSGGSSLKDEIGPDLYGRTLTIFKNYGIEEEQIKDMKAFFVLNSLSSLPLRGYNPASGSMGIDKYFMNRANHEGLPIKSLETVKIQMDALEDYYGKDHKRLRRDFQQVIEAFEKGEEAKFINDSQELKRAWADGNQERILGLISASGESKALFENRNILISEKILDLLEKEEDKVYFLIVGAGHLIGENSIIEYLEESGLELRKIQ